MAKKRKRSRRKSHHTTALAPRRRRRSSPRRYHGRRRRSAGGGNIKLTHALAAGAAVGYLTADNYVGAQLNPILQKIPGAKTFGSAAALGVTALAIDKYVHRNKYLKLIGIGGIVAAAYQLGNKGFKVQWVGDDPYALAGDDDMIDADMDDE